MNFSTRLFTLLCIFFITMMFVGCSKAKSIVEPSTDIMNEIPASFDGATGNRGVIAVYDAVIDPEAKTFKVEPCVRDLAYHYPLTQLYPNSLSITAYGFTPNFWAEIKLSHPLPGSGIDGFDPRVITILPARTGVSFYYPTLNAYANNSVVLEPDGYTKLFDNLGGSIFGNTNPFKAYFKDQPYRRWSSTGVTSETQRWQMNLSGFGGSMQFKLVVDVSTNYPNPPQSEIDNSAEPIQISASVGSGLTNEGGSAEIDVTIFDWQGRMSIGGVLVEAPDLFNGSVNLSYSTPGPYPNEYIYIGTITNEKLAPAGEYKYLVAAWDQTTSIYIYNEFTVKVSYISHDGNLIWAKRAGGTKGDYGNAITTLSDDSTVVTGVFGYPSGGSATFGPGEPNETVLTSAGFYDIFIAKYNPNGTLAWAKRAGGSSIDEGRGITTLSDNIIVVTGRFSESATFGLGEPNQTVLTSFGDYDVFIARYNPDGTLVWAKRAGGSSSDGGYGITALSDNSTVVTGCFDGSATFGPSEPNEKVLTSAGSFDIFIAHYNPDGTLAWAKRAGGPSSDYGRGITTLSDNSTVVTGCFEGTTTFGPGEPNEKVLWSVGDPDIFIARYNPDGTLAWAKRAGGLGYDESLGIKMLSDNSTVVTGWFKGSATFGPGEPNETVLPGGNDFFIARYNPNGTLAWAKSAVREDYNEDIGYGITTLSDDSTVVTGYFQSSVTFGPGEINQTVLTSAGYRDIFIARYNPDGTLSRAKRAGGDDEDWGCGITTLSDNSTVVIGCFNGSAKFGLGEPDETILISAGGSDIFIARFLP